MFFAIMIMAFAFTTVNAQFVNQPEFSFGQHQVMPGESLRKISHLYYGSENTTLILLDNPWLYKKASFNTAGEVVNYRIYPGDVLKVRNFAPTVQPVEPNEEPTTVVNNYPETGSFTDTPTFWLMFAFLVAVVIGFLLLLGYIWGRNKNSNLLRGNTGSRTYIKHEEHHHHHPTELHVLVFPFNQVDQEKEKNPPEAEKK